MALTPLYFSTTAAGAEDGTTWENRAALFSAGNWSTLISGFDFTSNGLLCYIGPGNYTCSQALTSAVTGTPDPSVSNPLILHGCDSGGVALTPPDPDWTSDQPAWSAATLPDLQTTSNISIVDLSNCHVRLLKFSAASGSNKVLIGSSTTTATWCHSIQATANTSAGACGAYAANCVLQCSGSSYTAVISGSAGAHNCKVIGNSAASSGNRQGINTNGSNQVLDRCTVYGNPGGGIVFSSSSASFNGHVINSVIANNTGVGILFPSTAAQTGWSKVIGCMITGNSTYGIDAQSQCRVLIAGNRLRDNTTANFNGTGNWLTTETNYVTDDSDANEYVDPANATAANCDFRIKSTATIANLGYGVSQQAAAATGGGSYAFIS